VADIRVDTGSAWGSWGASIDLDRGAITWDGNRSQWGSRSIAAHHLRVLRANATAAHTRGDLQIREQFADGCVDVKLTVDGQTVNLTYETDGGNYCKGAQPIWDYVKSLPPSPGDKVCVRWDDRGVDVDLARAELTVLGSDDQILLPLKDVQTLHWHAKRVITEGEHRVSRSNPKQNITFELTLEGETTRFWYYANERRRSWVRSLWTWVEEHLP